MSDITKEPEHDKVYLPPLPLVKNEPSIIKKEFGSLEAGNPSTKQRAESDDVRSLPDCPITNVKTEVLDDASFLEDEWSGGAGCLSYAAALTKQELDIGPTELQPPDMHFMLQPCKPDPDYHKPPLIVEDIPQGHELLPSEEEEFTERSDNDLPLRNSPEILPEGMCGSMSPHIQRVQTVSLSAHTDTPKVGDPVTQVGCKAITGQLGKQCLVLDPVKCFRDIQDNNVLTYTITPPLSTRRRGQRWQKQMNPHNELLAQSSISSDLIKHIRVHPGEERLKCKTCNKSFSQSNSLSMHIRTHTAEKLFECKTCGKRLSHKGSLTAHMRTHTGEKPFQCKICLKRFSRNAFLTAHTRVHTGEKPFECQTCGKRFSRIDNLTVHMRMHTGEKPYECKTCGKQVGSKSNLSSHMRVHAVEKPFECKTCGKQFGRKSSLSSHMRVHTVEKQNEHLTRHIEANKLLVPISVLYVCTG